MGGLFQAGQKAGLTNVVQLRSKRVFSTFPIGAKRKTPLGSNSTRSVSYHHFEWAFPSRAKSRVDERRPIAFKTRFFDFPHRGETKKQPWDRIPRGRFHTTILSGLFQAGQKAGLTNVVQFRSKRVFSSFPFGAKRKNTIGYRIPRRSVSYHDFEWAFRKAGQKAGLTNVVQLRSKRVFSTFPIRAKRKNTLGIEFHEVGFIPPFWVGFWKSRAKSRVDERRPIPIKTRFFAFRPSGRNETTPLGSNSTRSVSYHHFEWAFPSRAKSRVDEPRPIPFKTRFFDFPLRGETKKHRWDRIPRGRFHTTILSGLFEKQGKKPG